MKKYVILAGVNGAGKSTLFSLIPSVSEIEKINLDETIKSMGDWQDIKVISLAGRQTIQRIRCYFEEGVSFSQETTLCGKTILRNIEQAKALGYRIEMHYVGLDSPETAKARVKNRVMHGGHGISDSDIDRRYVETLQNLKIVLPLCDLAVIYDNTIAFRRFAIYKNGKCVIKSKQLPLWYSQIQEEQE